MYIMYTQYLYTTHYSVECRELKKKIYSWFEQLCLELMFTIIQTSDINNYKYRKSLKMIKMFINTLNKNRKSRTL